MTLDRIGAAGFAAGSMAVALLVLSRPVPAMVSASIAVITAAYAAFGPLRLAWIGAYTAIAAGTTLIVLGLGATGAEPVLASGAALLITTTMTSPPHPARRGRSAAHRGACCSPVESSAGTVAAAGRRASSTYM